MKIFVVSNEKGGVGKTLFAHHLARYLAERGRVLAVDLDQQEASLSRCLDGCRSPGVPGDPAAGGDAMGLFAGRGVPPRPGETLTLAARDKDLDAVDRKPFADMAKALRRGLDACAPHYDACVIDTPPAYGVRTASAMFCSDRLLAPVELAESSLDAVNQTVGLLEMVRAAAGRPPPDLIADKLLVVSRFHTRSTLQRKQAEALLAQVGMIVVPGALRLRDPYQATYAARRPVWDMVGPDGRLSSGTRAAADEMRALLAAVVGGGGSTTTEWGTS